MYIDMRDYKQTAILAQSAAYEDIVAWVTAVKPNMIVAHTLCVMDDPFSLHSKLRSPFGVTLQATEQELQKNEPLWRHKLEELGLDITRWRVDTVPLIRGAGACKFYITIDLNAPEKDKVVELINRIKESDDLGRNIERELTHDGFFRVAVKPRLRLECITSGQRYTQIIIHTTAPENPIETLDNPDLQDILQQFNKCLAPVQEPWEADKEETLTEVIRELCYPEWEERNTDNDRLINKLVRRVLEQ